MYVYIMYDIIYYICIKLSKSNLTLKENTIHLTEIREKYKKLRRQHNNGKYELWWKIKWKY